METVAIADFLKENGLEAYVDKFTGNNITVRNLPLLVQNRFLLDKLGVDVGAELSLNAAVNRLKQSESGSSSGSSRGQSVVDTSSTSSSSTQLPIQEVAVAVAEEVAPLPVPVLITVDTPVVLQADPDCTVIKDILRQYVIGLAVIASYEQKSCFDPSTAVDLAKQVILHEFGSDPQKDITAHRFKFLADCISKEFPVVHAGPEIWYKPSTTINGTTSLPTGKLYDQYTSITKRLRAVGLRDSRRGLKRPAEGPLERESLLNNIPEGNLSEEEITERLKILETEINEWNLISKYWKETFRSRYKSLTEGAEGNLTCKYLETYPALKQPQGFKLLEQDFKTLFPDAHSRIYSHWDDFKAKVCTELGYYNIKVPDVCSDAEFLHLFTRLFNVVPIKVPKGKAWKPSRKDVLDGFLCHLKTEADRTVLWEQIRVRNLAKGLSWQPFPVVVGPSLSRLDSFYLMIDQTPYHFETTKEVFAAAFYAYHALYTSYPIQSARMWVVIEKALFGVDNVTDPQSTSLLNNPDVRRLSRQLKV